MTRRQALAVFVLPLAASCARRVPAEPAEVHRVVSLAPSTTEALFAVGAGDRVVGRSTFCDYPPEATHLPAVGGMDPSVEAVLELRPDLVVGLAGAASARLAEKLAAGGVPTWLPPDGSIAEIEAMVRGIGQRTGHSEDARRVVAGIDQRVAAVEAAVVRAARPRTLMVVSVAPVVVAGPGSFADELLHRAGAVNVVARGGAWQTIALEHVLELDPDVVLDASGGGEGDSTRITSSSPGWGALRAVREPGHVLPIRDDRILRAGPRIGEGLTMLARLLHPEVSVP